jgi:hypothetical protein
MGSPIENQKLTFSLVTLDDSWEFFCSDYVDKHNVEDTDGFAEYTENYNGKVKANINYCVIGESDTETESPTLEQLEFICDHWNELSDKAEILENDTFYVEVENEETEDEDCDLEP